jgi:hypothetical protein
MLACVRCHPEQLTAESVQRLESVFGSPDMRQNIQKAFTQKKRWPMLSELPIVGGVDLDDVTDLVPLLIKELHEMVGIHEVRERLKRHRRPSVCGILAALV